MPRARVNGVQLYYEITGDSGPPMVLVHGSWGNHNNWALVVPDLAQSFRVLTYDRRGHSQSEPSTGEGTFDQDVEDLGALIQHLDLAPAVIVGNSFGAIVTLGLAARRPDLFLALSVHEPPMLGLLDGDPQYQALLAETNARIAPVLELIRQGDAAGAAVLFVETVAIGPGAWPQLPPPLQQTFIENASTFLDESRDPGWLAIDLEALSGFGKPAALTRGDQSPPFFDAILSKVGRALPHRSEYTYVGASHIPHISHPSTFIARTREFAKSAVAGHGAGTGHTAG